MPEIKAENVKVAYLGLDVRYDLKKVEMNLPDLDYILNVGKIDRIKNQRLFIGLAEVLKKNNKKILILLVGPSDLEEKEYINKTIKEKNLENYFLFTNALNRDSVYYLMQNSLLYIHTAQMESFGMAIVEAIGSGATVLVRENDAIDEILQGNREGVFGRDFTELEFYTFVNAFLESKEKRENLKKMQGKIFKSKYTIEKMRDSFLKYYKEFEVAENG
jgi:glycosyltransferase involved in cell wall biosynthesis